MKISVLSDLHLDFYVNPNKLKIQGQLKMELDDYLDDSEDVEVLIIAGDLTHYNHQIKLIELMAEMYNYQRVFCVLGNHDFYLVSQSQRNKYKSSINRERAWYDYSDPKGIVHILNGDIIEYRGVSFGGCASFYDGVYTRSSMYGETALQKWNRCMNDSSLIKGMGDLYDISEVQNNKIPKILKADIVITHVCPVASSMAFQDQYKSADTNGFYCFDGAHFVEETNAKYWVYGHSHGHHEFEIYDTKLIMNAMGYPNEHTSVKKTIIEIEEP